MSNIQIYCRLVPPYIVSYQSEPTIQRKSMREDRAEVFLAIKVQGTNRGGEGGVGPAAVWPAVLPRI